MEKFSKIIVLTIIGLSAAGALYVCCSHTLSHRSRTAEIDIPSKPSLPEVRRARLVFAGDLMQHTPQLTAARTPEGDFDFNASFDWVRERFRAADAAIVNLETTLSESGPYTGYPCFRSPAALAEALDSLGVDITVLANNHCCDGGSKGIRTTIRELDRHGIEHTGVFLDSSDFRARHPLRFEAGGIRFALLNYTYGTNGLPVPSGLSVNPIDTVRIAADLAAVEHDGVDCVIACMHWGNEYQREPNDDQIRLAQSLADGGADIIFASHPHVLQKVDTLNAADGRNVPVFYSMGNFISNQRTETLPSIANKRYTEQGMMAVVDLSVMKSTGEIIEQTVKVIPTWVDRYGSPVKYSIIPLDQKMDSNEVLKTSGHLDRAREALSDIETLIGADYLNGKSMPGTSAGNSEGEEAA